MATLYSKYYGLVRINNSSPSALGWAATDFNFQWISLLINAVSQHHHGAATPITYPGYNFVTPATPISPALSASTVGGSLSPGAAIGVRLSYLDANGLETAGSPETIINLPVLPDRPNAPSLANPVATPVPGALFGGTRVYAITKVKNNGETQISNTTSVNIPFDPVNSYTLGMSFDPISSYTDGTTALNIYESSGFNAQMSLVTQITNVSTTTYTDTGTYLNVGQSPPTINQFNKNYTLLVDWSAMIHPVTATQFNLYISQQPGQYGVTSLIQAYPMNQPGTPLPSSYSYLGSEVPAVGWPKNFSQVVTNPPRVNLGVEATGAPILTSNMDFQGFTANNFVLTNNVNTATPIPGAGYYEPSIPAIRFYLNGAWQTVVAPTGSYVHPIQEQGGHITSNILYPRQGGPDLTAVLNTIATPVTPFRKQVTKVYKATATPVPLHVNTSASTAMSDMVIGPMIPDFAGQWCEVAFSADMNSDTPYANTSIILLANGVNQSETTRTWTTASGASPLQPSYSEIGVSFATPISAPMTIQVNWFTSTGNAGSLGGRRSLVGKVLF